MDDFRKSQVGYWTLPDTTSAPEKFTDCWKCDWYSCWRLKGTYRTALKHPLPTVTVQSSAIYVVRLKDDSPARLPVRYSSCRLLVQSGPKSKPPNSCPYTSSPNIDRFLNLFHCYTEQEVCNKDPTTSKKCHYTTLQNISLVFKNCIDLFLWLASVHCCCLSYVMSLASSYLSKQCHNIL